MERNYIHKFSEIKELPFALEYEDIRLISRHSELPPDTEISLKTYLTNSIPLNGVLIGAPMPTAVGPEMCIALGLTGNFGVLPKGIDIETQVEQGKQVKRFSSGFITEPETLSPEDSILKALDIKNKKGFSTMPVTEDGSPHGKLVGLLTKYVYSEKNKEEKVKERMLTLEDIEDWGMLHYKRPSLLEAEEIMRKNNFGKLLVVDESGYLDSMVTWGDVIKREEFPNAILDDDGRIKYGAAVGGPGRKGDLEKRISRLIKEAGVDALFVETAQADSMGVLKLTKKIIDDYARSYDIPVIWGNIDNYKSAENIASICENNDAIKVGIGPGSICTTREVTGAGNPQVSAIAECTSVAKERGLRCIADGGIGSIPSKASGNIIKAIAAGADSVMVGGLVAGTDESPGEIIEKDGIKYKKYVGMASPEGLKAGGGTRYYTEVKDAVVQGKTIYIPYKGSIYDVIGEVNKNLRYSMRVHYNVKSIKELQEADLEFSVLASAVRKVA